MIPTRSRTSRTAHSSLRAEWLHYVCKVSTSRLIDIWTNKIRGWLAPLCRPFLFGRTFRHDSRLATHATSGSPDFIQYWEIYMPRARLPPLICDPVLIRADPSRRALEGQLRPTASHGCLQRLRVLAADRAAAPIGAADFPDFCWRLVGARTRGERLWG
jgi:hypothetical protein